MRKYETIVILDPDISSEKRDSFFEKVNELISQENGLLIETDVWGTQKLAYEIRKKVRGNYTCLLYCGTGALVNEMERSFQIDDRILKYMTVLLDKDIDIEKIKAEMAAAAAAEAEDEAADDSSEKPSSDDEAAPETPAPETSDDAPESDAPESEPAAEENQEATQTESNEEEN